MFSLNQIYEIVLFEIISTQSMDLWLASDIGDEFLRFYLSLVWGHKNPLINLIGQFMANFQFFTNEKTAGQMRWSFPSEVFCCSFVFVLMKMYIPAD